MGTQHDGIASRAYLSHTTDHFLSPEYDMRSGSHARRCDMPEARLASEGSPAAALLALPRSDLWRLA